MVRRVETTGDGAILYDDALLGHPDPALFDPAHWPDVPRATRGRGAALFIRHAGEHWVLRHYRRGGLVGRLLDDQLAWLGAARTRAFREWSLLAELVALGLPVPRPVAARYRRRGLVYTADLITVRLPGVRSLAERLADDEAGEATWYAVGACIRRFHELGVWHADLNAHNVQVDESGQVWLLDFDRCRRRRLAVGWRRRNLARLQRSLARLREREGLGFTGQHWQWLLAGYGRADQARAALPRA
jgi:3-deoxy-D-manno-octulosonic acid kinase